MTSLLISDLQIGEFLGRGHFGAVYLGQEPAAGAVAVKIIRPDPDKPLSDWHRRKADLLREGQNLRKAQHTNVVRVHNILASHTDDALHLVMDLCSGGSLVKECEVGPMSLASVRKVATEVTHGLQAIHTRGMIHRDIKPGNILRDAAGVAKIGDFGLVTDEIVLGYAKACGYVNHLAPEVRDGKGTSVKSDIWALGMTLFRLLHGSDWYNQTANPRYAIPEGNFRDALVWLPHIPKAWRRLIRQMLCDDTSRRISSSGAVLSALSKLPIHPDWDCFTNVGQVSWSRAKGTRLHSVTWDISDLKKCEWLANNTPVGTGNILKLGASSSPQVLVKSSKDLNEFFSNYT